MRTPLIQQQKTYPITHPDFRINVSVYRNSFDKIGTTVTLNDAIKRIKHGNRGLDEKTRHCHALALTEPEKYKKYKARHLPAVTFACVMSSRHTEKSIDDRLKQHSGHITIDIDGLNPSEIPDLLAQLAQMPEVVLAFVSPSGMGIKVIVRVDPTPQDAQEHKGAFQACVAFFGDLATEFGFQIDTSGSDVSRLCYLAHDPLAIVNTNALPIAWDRDAYLASLEKQTTERANVSVEYDGDVDVAALNFIDPDEKDPSGNSYKNWLDVGMGCKNAGLPVEAWIDWSRASKDFDENEIRRKWNTFDSYTGEKITWGTVVHLAKQYGYKPLRSFIRRPVKLEKNLVSMLTETLDKSREFLQFVFSNKKIKFFGLRADTGVGKNETAITFFLRGFSGLVNVPTTDLGKELQARFHKAEIDAFRYRGILSNPDGEFPDENPCIHAVRYDAIASRGWNAYQLLCESCEVREVCEERGYRSQVEQAKKAQVTVMPFPDIFMNPAFRSLAKEFLPTYSDDLILHDEFDSASAFLKIDVPKSRLVHLRDDWNGYDPSYFAKELLRILEVEGDLSLLRKLVLELTDAEREAILEGLTCVMFNGQILTREDAHRCDDFRMASRSLDTIHTLPRLETDSWNLLIMLELFFERYSRASDMPMKYENDTLTFMLPPLPMKTRARMGFMSATLTEPFFRRAFDNREKSRGDVSFHDTGLTEWHPEAKVYQLRTNRNPRATAYTPKGERVDGQLLSPSGAFFFDLVADDLKHENRGLITYKLLIKERAAELEGIPTANFGGLVGLDTHFQDVDVLHILFSPELPLTEVEFKVKMLFGDDTEPLSFDRDADGHYIDARLQACYEDGVISELLQAIGRGRLVSKPVTVVIWCSHFLPGITDREQTLLFDEFDWDEADGDIKKLADVVEAREAAELNGDVQAYAEATGQSERTARRQTQQTRQQTKAERNAEIVRRYAGGDGETQQEIADALGIGLATVNRVLKA